MKLIDKTLDELEIDQAELSTIRQQNAAAKQSIQARLAEINTKCLQRLPRGEFVELQKERSDLAQQIAQIETRNAEFKNQSKELHAIIEFKRRSALQVKGLIAIRDEWHSYSLDDKNERVKRQLAWKFSEQLTQYLKPYFDNHSTPLIYG